MNLHFVSEMLRCIPKHLASIVCGYQRGFRTTRLLYGASCSTSPSGTESCQHHGNGGSILRPAVSSQSPFHWPGYEKGIERATTPPSSWYKDAAFLNEVEANQTFRKHWLLVGRTDELLQDGDYLARTIMKQPLLIVKNSSTTTNSGYQAFFNVCRHHAAQICDEGKGHLDCSKGQRFTCPYHGWQYNIEGKLTKAVKMKGCQEFSVKDFGLVSVPLAIVGPWIYVKFPTPGTQTTSTIHDDLPDLIPIETMLQKSNYTDLIHLETRKYILNCNWKVFIDNYLDGGYHVPVAHKQLSSNLQLKDYKRYGYDNFYLQTCPPKEEPQQQDLAKDRLTGQEALYIYQYPNICINRYGSWMDTNIVWPIGPNQCEVIFDWYIHKDLVNQKDMIEESIKQSDVVQQEDIWLCDRVQAGIESWGYEVGRYAPELEGK